MKPYAQAVRLHGQSNTVMAPGQQQAPPRALKHRLRPKNTWHLLTTPGVTTPPHTRTSQSLTLEGVTLTTALRRGSARVPCSLAGSRWAIAAGHRRSAVLFGSAVDPVVY